MNSELELACELKRLLLRSAEARLGDGAVKAEVPTLTSRQRATCQIEQPAAALAVAESLTCGRVQAAIGTVSGASQFFLGGVTAYTGEQKVALLGVSRVEGEPVNWVSAAVAEQMACGAAQLFGSDFALATTGYAEPSLEWGVPAPFAWWALAQRKRGNSGDVVSDAVPEFMVRSERVECPGCSRVEVQKAVTTAALAGLCEYLRVCLQHETGCQKADLHN